MVRFYIQDKAASQVGEYMDTLRGRILQAIREQMFTEMEDLALTVADKFNGNPLFNRTGNLVDKILQSPKVVQTNSAIRGSVSAQDGAKNLGLWLEEGTTVPGLLPPGGKARVFAFLTEEDAVRFTRGHRAFKVKPHPFMVPSLEEREAPILENIRRRVADAIA